jgi:hypothetical protein
MFNGNTVNYQNAPLTNDGFWPDLNLREFQEHRKLPADLDNDMLANALLATVAEINLDLAGRKLQLQAQGYQTAAAVSGISINGTTELVSQYKRAVYARAKADLMGEYTSLVSRTPNPGQESPEVQKRLLAEAAVTLRSMKGLKRATVRSI